MKKNIIPNLLNRIPTRAYLFLGVTLLVSGNSVVRKLTEIGADSLIDGRNPISFCNVLFAGNLCSLLIFLLLFGKQWNQSNLSQLSRKDWFSLTLVAVLHAAVAPSLIFIALSLTMVNDVILIGRIEPALILALSVFVLKDRVNAWVVAGAIVSSIGVVLTVLLQTPGLETEMVKMGEMASIGRGALLAGLGATIYAIANVISKAKLGKIPLGIFTVFRAALGTVVFFSIASVLFGPAHFMDIFSPFLWKWMLFYGGVILVGGQLGWYIGLGKAGASEVSLATSFTPIAGILAAFVILGEAPTFAQYLGGGVIIVGIILNRIGILRQLAEESAQRVIRPNKEVDMAVGFKGV